MLCKGHAMALLIEALRYKSEGRGFDMWTSLPTPFISAQRLSERSVCDRRKEAVTRLQCAATSLSNLLCVCSNSINAGKYVRLVHCMQGDWSTYCRKGGWGVSLGNPYAYFYVCSMTDAGSGSSCRVLYVLMETCHFPRDIFCHARRCLQCSR
jgi:hypothetical protein